MRSIGLIILVVFLTACGLRPAERPPGVTPPPTAPPPTAGSVPATTPPTPAAPATSAVSSSDAATAQQATARELAEIAPPFRDDVALAAAYRGADPAATPRPPDDLAVGTIEPFYIGNVDDNTISQIEATLAGVGDNAYFWFDSGPGGVEPDPAALAGVVAQFDEIYEAMFALFGRAGPAGGRVHIVHASPGALCLSADQCGLAGYFSGSDELPRSVNPWSNERPMFVMNARQFGGGSYLPVLTHELRHMLGESYDRGKEDWFVEGGATLAEDLMGFTASPQLRGALFLQNPDQQLNSWPDENTIPYYGQGYLVNRFLYDRLGAELYQEFLLSPRPGLSAVDDVAARHGLALTGEGLWLDWLAAMALNDHPDAPEPYRWQGPELGPVEMEIVNSLPATFDATVGQYAADYYELPEDGSYAIDFTGVATVPLLGSPAPSGAHFWYAQRANTSNPRLTRAFDLRGVESATLRYQVYADIELGYDFAYVAVSTDGGQRWQALAADGMQGLAPEDDPSDVALADRFYTGRTRRWIAETVDLTPFAGQEVLLRFEYVTDPIKTFGGFAIDDIAIPEIGYADNAETADDGWLAEGFTRATAELPQAWQLQLITFDEAGRPAVERLPVSAEGTLFAYPVEALPGARRPILIVSATAPETLQAAVYRLSVH